MSGSISQTPRRVEVSNRALTDLDEIWAHFSGESEETAVKILKQITNKFSQLLNFPKIAKKEAICSSGCEVFPPADLLFFIRKRILESRLSELFTAQEIFSRYLTK